MSASGDRRAPHSTSPTPSAVVVMGVSGSGKSTVATALAKALGASFIEADDLHTPESIARMRRGIALDEAARQRWLARVRSAIAERLARGETVVVACSALRREHRAQLRIEDTPLSFVYLRADRSLLEHRLRSRKGHFFAPALLESQLELLEEPANAILVDASRPVDEIVAHARRALDRDQDRCVFE